MEKFSEGNGVENFDSRLDHEALVNQTTIENQMQNFDDVLTQLPEYYAHTIIYIWAAPFLIMTGTVGNTLSFIIMRKKSMRSTSSCFYLAILAIADTIALYLGYGSEWLNYTAEIDVSSYGNFVCKTHPFLLDATLYTSVWLIVSMTTERFIVVWFPLRAKQLCTVRRAKCVVVLLVSLVLLLTSHHLWTAKIVDGRCETENVVSPFITATFYAIIPFLLLTIFNSLIIYTTMKAKQTQQGMTGTVAYYRKNSDFASKSKLERDSSITDENSIIEIKTKSKSAEANMDYLTVDRARCHCWRGKRFCQRHGKGSVLNIKLKRHNNKLQMDKFNKMDDRTAICATPTGSCSGESSGAETDVSTLSKRYGSEAGESAAAEKRTRTRRGRGSPISSQSSANNNHKVTAMLLLVSFAFLVTAVPVTIIQIVFFHIHADYVGKYMAAASGLEEAGPTMDDERRFAKVLLATAIGRVLAYGNHASNFFLYCISGQKFRDEVRQLWWGSSRRRRHRHSRYQIARNNTLPNSSSSSSSQKILIRSEHVNCVQITITNDQSRSENL